MAITSLLNQTITIYPKTGVNKYGRETNDAGTTKRARVQFTSKAKLMPNGETQLIDAIVYIDGSVSVSVDDKVTFSGVNYRVVGRRAAVLGSGATHHYKLELQKWV